MNEETKKIYAEAVEARACEGSLTWLSKNGLNYEKLAREASSWYLFGAGKCKSWEIIHNLIQIFELETGCKPGLLNKLIEEDLK